VNQKKVNGEGVFGVGWGVWWVWGLGGVFVWEPGAAGVVLGWFKKEGGLGFWGGGGVWVVVAGGVR